MSDPDDSECETAQDREAAFPDPVTGSTDHAAGADQAADDRETESPG